VISEDPHKLLIFQEYSLKRDPRTSYLHVGYSKWISVMGLTNFSVHLSLIYLKKIMALCPCCTDVLLHHILPGKSYWFCRSCWSEMPNFEDYHVTKVHVGKVRSPLSISKTIESDLVPHIHPPNLIIMRPKSTNSANYAEIVA
jgi:hypothetical protein